MSTIISNANSMIFGCLPMLPTRGFPEGRIRIRLRNDDFAEAYVFSPQGIRCFYIKESECGDWWEPAFEKGRNYRIRLVEMMPMVEKIAEGE